MEVVRATPITSGRRKSAKTFAVVSVYSASCRKSTGPFFDGCLSEFLPPANEVWGKVIFSVACVKNSVHKGEYLGRYPPGRYTPLGQVHPRAVHPPGRYTPGQVHPLGRYTPTPLVVILLFTV